MKLKRVSSPGALLVMLLFLGMIPLACTNNPPYVAPAPLMDESTFRSQASGESTGPIVAVQTPIPIVSYTLAGTPVPLSWESITEENVENLIPLARWGYGDFREVFYSPDGRTLAITSTIGVYLFDSETLEEVGSIETAERVVSASFSPDGKLLAIGFLNGEIHVLNYENRALIEILETVESDPKILDNFRPPFATKDSGLRKILFSPEGSFLAAISGMELRLWLVSDWSLQHTLTGHNWPPLDVVFSPDGSIVASTGDNTAKLWSVTDGEVIATLQSLGRQGFASTIFRLAISSDGAVIATGGQDGDVDLWSVSDGSWIAALIGPAYTAEGYASVTAMTFSPGGLVLAYGSVRGKIIIRDTTGADRWELETSGAVESLTFSQDGTRLTSVSDDNRVRIWQDPDWDQVVILDKGPGEGLKPYFNSDSSQVVWGGSMWRVADGTMVERPYDGSSVISPDGHLVASMSLGSSNEITIWDISSNEVIHKQTNTGYVDTMSISHDEKLIASVGIDHVSNNLVQVWDAYSGDVVDTKVLDYVFDLRFSPASYELAVLFSLGEGTSVVVYNPMIVHIPWSRNLQSFSYQTVSFTFSPDGETIALIDEEQIILLDTVNGEEYWITNEGLRSDSLIFQGGIAFSPDGSLIAAGGDSIQFRRSSDGGLISTLEGVSGTISPGSFSLDGRMVAISDGGVLWIYGVSPFSLVPSAP